MTTAAYHTAHEQSSRFLMVVNQADRRDPSRTTSLRNSFSREMRVRFRRLTQLINKAVVEEDVFGLMGDGPRITALKTHQTPGPRAFAFTRDSRKVSAFMDWLNRMTQAHILDVRDFSQVGEGVERAWTNKYIYDSYSRGVQRARYQMRQGGWDVPPLDATGGIDAAMSTPFHIDRVGLLFTRTFNELRGITGAMDQSISRILSIGMANGENPITLARRMNKYINGPGLELTDTLGRFIPARRRAELLARTEIIRAHAEAQLNEFENWGVEGVQTEAEVLTAQDDRVCPICLTYHGEIFSLQQAHNMIPFHPQCRCIWLPYSRELARRGLISRVRGEENVVPEDAVAAAIKNPAHRVKYLKYKSEYGTKIDDYFKNNPGMKEMLQEWQNARAWDRTRNGWRWANFLDRDPALTRVTDIFRSWQGSTQNLDGLGLKVMAGRMERKLNQTVFFDWDAATVKARMREFLSPDDYLRWRGFSQAYMERMYADDVFTLYRGTNGGEGNKIKKTIEGFLQEQRVRTTFHMKDSSLAGYASDSEIAANFGQQRGGISIRHTFNRADVIAPDSLISGITDGFRRETEWIVKGISKPVNMMDVSFEVRFTNGSKLIKDYGETLAEFRVRLNAILQANPNIGIAEL